MRARAGWKGWMRLLVKSDGLVRFFVVLMDSLHFFMGIHSTVFLRCRHQASRGNGNKKNRGSKGKKGKKEQIHHQNLCILALYTYSSSISLEFFSSPSVDTSVLSKLQRLYFCSDS